FDALPAVAPLLTACATPGDDVLRPMADEVVTFRAPRHPLEAIKVLGHTLIVAGQTTEQPPPAAARYYLAAFALGEKLFRERLVYDELSAGNALMAQAAISMSKITREPERAEEWTNFESARRQFARERVAPLWQAIASI